MWGQICYVSVVMPKKPIIKQIDHIFIIPNDVDAAFDFLTKQIKLPVHWPMQKMPEGFLTATCGISFNNISLELVKFKDPSSASASGFGIAFEPQDNIEEAIEAMKQRNISFDDPIPFFINTHGGARKKLFTNIFLPSLSIDMHVFLCKFHYDQKSGQAYKAVNYDGGPLGIKSIKEIIIGTNNYKSSCKEWAAILDPHHEITQGYWQVGEGPAIRIIQSDKNSIESFVVAVESLQKAQKYLLSINLPHVFASNYIDINSKIISPAKFKFIEG
jgi:hypothetical protein